MDQNEEKNMQTEYFAQGDSVQEEKQDAAAGSAESTDTGAQQTKEHSGTFPHRKDKDGDAKSSSAGSAIRAVYEKMNLPNKLTILRMLLIPFYVIFMLCSQYVGMPFRIAALVIFIAASVTDFLDGHIARSRNLVTTFGKFMDPLADKLLVCTALICFVDLDRIASWIVIIIIAREFIISGFRLIAAEQGKVIAAGMWGKIKTAVTMVTIIIMIPAFPGTAIHILETVLIYASLALTIISLVDYLVKNKDVIGGDY